MINDIFVFDDFIPLWYQDEIERILFDEAQWNLKYDVTYSRDIFNKLQEIRPGLRPRPGFHHPLVTGGQVSSPIHLFLKPMLYTACEKINVKLKEVMLGRSFLQLPLSNINYDIKDPLHVDSYNEHMVFLYYVVSSDGKTLLTDCKCEFSDSENNLINKTFDDCNIIKSITPKKGRLVLFDGRHYHAAEQSKDSIRCIINYNLRVEKNEVI